MEMPLYGYPNQPVNGISDFLMDADNNNIRLFTVKRAIATSPQDTCSGEWMVSSAECGWTPRSLKVTALGSSLSLMHSYIV